MGELKPETKIERVLTKIRPLAEWYAKNKPAVTVIRVTADDMKLLTENPDVALAQGIFVQDNQVKWRGFEIRSA